MSNLDSVFSNSAEDEVEFDVMFDQEDSLIDTVNGVNESGDPLTGVDFEDLHQTQDDEDAKGVKDVQSDDQPMGAKNMEGTNEPTPDDNSIKGEENKSSDADDLYKDACPISYLDGNGANPDENSVNNTIEKEIKESETIDIDAELDGKKDDPVQDGQTSPVIKEGEEENIDIDAELDNEEDAVSESSEDIDIDAELDNDVDDAEVDTAVEEEAGEEGGKYSYDPSDEDLIDAAINGNI